MTAPQPNLDRTTTVPRPNLDRTATAPEEYLTVVRFVNFSTGDTVHGIHPVRVKELSNSFHVHIEVNKSIHYVITYTIFQHVHACVQTTHIIMHTCRRMCNNTMAFLLHSDFQCALPCLFTIKYLAPLILRGMHWQKFSFKC